MEVKTENNYVWGRKRRNKRGRNLHFTFKSSGVKFSCRNTTLIYFGQAIFRMRLTKFCWSWWADMMTVAARKAELTAFSSSISAPWSSPEDVQEVESLLNVPQFVTSFHMCMCSSCLSDITLNTKLWMCRFSRLNCCWIIIFVHWAALDLFFSYKKTTKFTHFWASKHIPTLE